jgi:lipopolysaccharide export system permease protein
MNILNRHILKNLLTVFFASLLVLTFVLMLGIMLKMVSSMDNGVSQLFITKMFVLTFPRILTFAVPISILVSVTLVFSRMSAENEVTAMRASGINLWQIVNPAIVLTIGCCALLFYLNMFVVPHLELEKRIMTSRELMAKPEAFLRAGHTVNLGGKIMTIGEKTDDGILKNVRVVDIDETNGLVTQQLLAREARLTSVDEKNFTIEFNDVLILSNSWDLEKGDEKSKGLKDIKKVSVARLPNEKTTYTFNIDQGRFNSGNLRIKDKYLNLKEMMARLAILRTSKEEEGLTKKEQYAIDLNYTRLLYALNKNLALSFTPLAFLLMALPFGFRSSRSETSIGVMMSLILMTVYYGVLLMTGALEKKIALHPEILVWIPNVLYQVIGVIMLTSKVKH